MKYTAILSIAGMALISLSSCGNGENNESAADTTVAIEATPPVTNEIVYYDLETGGALKKDESSGKYVDEKGTPSKFYVDVQAADTFEAATGRNVNNAMTRVNNTWGLDETKVKINEEKMVVEDENSKLKVKEDKAKLITEDKKVKAKTDKDGNTEVKVKER